MFFQSLTRGIDIGANSYLLSLNDFRIVLDAGIHPKIAGAECLPQFDRLDFDSIDAVFVSHAHLDHIGASPVLARQQPGARFFGTEETLALGKAMLHNSVNVMKAQRTELGLAEYPLFTHREIDGGEWQWTSRPCKRPFRIGDRPEVEATLFPAGHILGAAGLQLTISGKTIFYTGDVNFEDHAICRGADFPSERIDTLIIETTRGDAARRDGYTREEEAGRLGAAIDRCLTRGGTVMMPVFAMGKTQEMLMTLHEMQNLGEIPMVPIQVGGLSAKMTVLYDRFTEMSRRKHAGFRFFSDMPMLESPQRRRGTEPGPELPFIPGRIYALSSGMMTENTVSHRFARHIVSDPKNALLFVGYADPDSPAGKILAAGQGEVVDLNNNGGRRTPLRCEVEKFDFSGHAPRRHLLDFVVRAAPGHVILVHGDESARKWVAAEIRKVLPETRVTIPAPGEKVDL